MSIQLANSAGGGSRLETSKKNKPTAESPNYGQVLSKSVYLPEDVDFAPVLTMFVKDVRFKGMGDVQVIAGHTFASAATSLILVGTCISTLSHALYAFLWCCNWGDTCRPKHVRPTFVVQQLLGDLQLGVSTIDLREYLPW